MSDLTSTPELQLYMKWVITVSYNESDLPGDLTQNDRPKRSCFRSVSKSPKRFHLYTSGVELNFTGLSENLMITKDPMVILDVEISDSSDFVQSYKIQFRKISALIGGKFVNILEKCINLTKFEDRRPNPFIPSDWDFSLKFNQSDHQSGSISIRWDVFSLIISPKCLTRI